MSLTWFQVFFLFGGLIDVLSQASQAELMVSSDMPGLWRIDLLVYPGKEHDLIYPDSSESLRAFSITILHSHIAKLLGLTSSFEAFGLGVSFQAGKRPVLKSLRTTTPTRLRSAGKWHPSPPRRPLALRVWFFGLPELCWMLFSVWRISDGLVKIFVVWKPRWKLHVAHLFLFKSFFGNRP